MTLSVDVETGRRDRALVGPLSALRDAPAPASAAVLVVEGGRTREQQVRLGLRTLDAVEVLEGLAAGNRVLLRGNVASGARVRMTLVPWRPGLGSAPAGTAEDPGSTLGNAFGR
jgi:HlyD family secretion protein